MYGKRRQGNGAWKSEQQISTAVAGVDVLNQWRQLPWGDRDVWVHVVYRLSSRWREHRIHSRLLGFMWLVKEGRREIAVDRVEREVGDKDAWDYSLVGGEATTGLERAPGYVRVPIPAKERCVT